MQYFGIKISAKKSIMREVFSIKTRLVLPISNSPEAPTWLRVALLLILLLLKMLIFCPL